MNDPILQKREHHLFFYEEISGASVPISCSAIGSNECVCLIGDIFLGLTDERIIIATEIHSRRPQLVIIARHSPRSHWSLTHLLAIKKGCVNKWVFSPSHDSVLHAFFRLKNPRTRRADTPFVNRSPQVGMKIALLTTLSRFWDDRFSLFSGL